MNDPADIEDLKSRAAQLLYRELPEEYRYRDLAEAGELGDLEAYLHGFGRLLDLIRGSTEQAYADAFAETADNGRTVQDWVIPYLAELVGAELRAPDPAMRRAELNNAVAWFKSKGTLDAVDEIADTISGAETVVVEGWRRTLVTPRMGLPPFTGPVLEADPLDGPAPPLGTPDLRLIDRAVQDPDSSNPLYRLIHPRRDRRGRPSTPSVSYWRPLNRRGAPCFSGAYDDSTACTPDLRDPEPVPSVGPHPKRTLIHVRPPEGFFTRGLNGDTGEPDAAPLTPDAMLIEPDTDTAAEQVFGPAELFAALGLNEAPPDRLILTGDLDLPAGVSVVLENLLFTGRLRVRDASTRLRLERCAVARLAIEVDSDLVGDLPTVEATDCLFDTIEGDGIAAGVGFAQLVYCTVLQSARLARLWASDCIFNGPVEGLDCAARTSCIRFSRVPDLAALTDCSAQHSPSNTDLDPSFIRLWHLDAGSCVLRPARFGEPGAGVLDLTTSDAIRAGAEDEGEMGCYHHRYYSAQVRALRLKLSDYLPFGQEIAIRFDPLLSRPPVIVEDSP